MTQTVILPLGWIHSDKKKKKKRPEHIQTQVTHIIIIIIQGGILKETDTKKHTMRICKNRILIGGDEGRFPR